MTFNFVEKVFSIGDSDVPPPLQFYKRGFVLGGSGQTPSWQDIILSGVGSLTLANAKADGLNYLKLFGGTEQRNLPSGYTQVEYLQSSGTQYIDTGIVLKSKATITTVGQFISISSPNPISIWGFMGNSNMPRWGWSVYNNMWLMDLNFTASQSSANTNKHTFVNETNGTTTYDSYVDGVALYEQRGLTNPQTYTSNVLSAYIFARNNSNTAGNFSSSRIYSFNIAQDDIEVINLIPARRNSDNVLGMYDTVTGNFLTNAGTGTFTAGADTVPTPDNPIDIVCNNGILKVSPNLFNKYLVPNANEYINKTNGNAASPASGEFRHSDFIVIKENTQYYVGIITSIATTAGLAFYDDTQTFISGISLTQLGNNDNIITSPNNTKYIRFSFRTDEGYNTNWQNTVYFVEGNQPLAEFMPYGAIYADGTVEQVTDSLGNTANAEMLLSVGDYKDTQEVISGSVTRNIGIKVFDGTESWTSDPVGTGGYIRFNYSWGVARKEPGFDILTNIFATQSGVVGPNATSAVISGHGTNPNIYLAFPANLLDGDLTTIIGRRTAFNNWLAKQYANGIPFIIVYQLAEPTTESVTGQTLTTQAGTNIVEITQASMNNLSLEISYKATN